jgi:hypothetical protein
VTSGSSYGGKPFPLTIGLGQARSILTLEVSWPTSRTRQTFHDLPIDRSIEIIEGREGFRILDTTPIPQPQDPATPPASPRRPSTALVPAGPSR